MALEFVDFGKIPRLFRDIVITEKIDGTNAAVVISDDGKEIGAQSRNRLITPDNDNAGFARWVEENKEELFKLGPGHHFGEWWGKGIGRNYGAPNRYFSLFNTARWHLARPACCDVVPKLYEGPFDMGQIEGVLSELRVEGSKAYKGFTKPEGIIVFHKAGNLLFKVTLEKDDEWKGKEKLVIGNSGQ